MSLPKDNDLGTGLEKFTGRAPVFPLPNVVFFPHVLLPLHVFEPRYREMVRDALAGDRLIAVSLLQPGWETTYESKLAKIHSMACLGRIVAEEQLPDGRYYIVLEGLSRMRVLDEDETVLPYRVARMKPVSDLPPPADFDVDGRRHDLFHALKRHLPEVNVARVFPHAVDDSVPLGQLCDVLGHALQHVPAQQQRLLEELDVRRRSELLLALLARGADPERGFPPAFSAN